MRVFALRVAAFCVYRTCLFAFIALFPANAWTQPFDLPPELAAEARDAFDRSVNAGVIFASQRATSSGVFNFREDGDGGDTRFELFSLPISHSFGDEKEELRIRVEANFSKARTSRSVTVSPLPDVPFEGGPDFSRTSLLSGTVGGGVDWNLGSGFSIRPLMSFSYSYVRRRYDYNNNVSRLIQSLFNIDRDVLNTSSHVVTYSPSMTGIYRREFGDKSAQVSVRYVHLWNDQVKSRSRILDVNGDSGMLQTVASGDIPLGFDIASAPVGLHPFIIRTDIWGAARSGAGLEYFHELGFDFTLGVEKTLKLVRELQVGTSYSFGDHFSGFRLGVGAEF